jgi:FSR family fosmidomycin resistance protein-like MFS transporter
MNTAATPSLGRDARVLTLVSTGHFMSHYSQMVLPPLFLLMNADLGVSFAKLGLIVTLINLSGAIVQIPVGFLVDRIGAKALLIAGLLIKTFALGAMAFTDSYAMLLILAVLAGFGHSVFHPADYAILMSSVDESRIGRAFSIHTASGNAGSAIAPLLIIMIATQWGWRGALISIAIFGAITALAIIMQTNVIKDHVGAKKKKGRFSFTPTAIIDGCKLLLRPNILVLYLFFVITAMITVGINSMTVTALTQSHGIAMTIAGTVLTTYLVGGLLGILIGGVIADKTDRHNLIAGCAFVLSAALFVLIGAYALSPVALMACYGLLGVALGLIRPARDMMVKAITNQGDAGKMFGFMSNGHFIGGALVPVLLGWVIDQGEVRWVFWLGAIFSIMALLSLITTTASTKSDDHAP